MSGIVMVGVSHRTAPLAVLERAARRRSDLVRAAMAAGAEEAVLLSTCCRTELYTVPARPGEDLVDCGWDGRAAVLTGDAVSTHLFRVASGLDSRIPGEIDVQTQIRRAMAEAAADGRIGPRLQRLFASSIATARRVHRDTALGGLGRSLGRRAVDVGLAMVDPDDASVVVVGSGRMAATVVEEFNARGITPVLCARNAVRMAKLSRDESLARPLGALIALLVEADLVVCATAADEPVIRPADVAGVASLRRGRPLTLVDLSMPRNVARSVAFIAGVHLVDLEGLGDDGGLGDDLRRALAEAEEIVREEASRYCADGRARLAGPVIAAMRAQVRSVCQEEVGRSLGTEPDRQMVERLAAALAGKLLHRPTVLAREAAIEGDVAALDYLARLFL